MPLAVVGFSVGLLFCQQLAQLPGIHWVLLLFVFIPSLFFIKNGVLKIIIWASLGFLWAAFFAHILLLSQLKSNLEGKDLSVTGTVCSIPHFDGNRTRFEFSVASLVLISQPETFIDDIPKTLLLNWYNDAPLLRFGDKLQLRVRLKRAHGYMNPGGFDYEAWVFRQRIDGTGYVKSTLNSNIMPVSLSIWEDSKQSLFNFIGRTRQIILEAQSTNLEQKPFLGILTALTVGDRYGISASQWQVLTNTGTNHLMAISGLHIGLVSGLFFFLTRRLWGYFPYLVNKLTAPQAAALCSIISATAYAALAGFSIPTQRALIMVSVVMLGIFLKRKIRAAHTLIMALFIILLLDPLVVLSAGFWLSFTAVGAIMYALNQRVANRGLWTAFGKVQFVTLIGLAPFLVMFFQKVSLVSPIANMIAVPWVSMVTIPLTLLGSLLVFPLPAVGNFLLNISHLSLELIWPLLSWLSEFSLSILQIATASLWALLLALLGVICILAPSGFPSKWFGVVFFVPLFMGPNKANPIAEGTAIFTLLDVGQGLSAVIRTSNHVLVYDAGPKFNINFDTGKAVVLPYLHSLGIFRINTLIVSHGDNDHIGGVNSIVENITVEKILTSVPQKIDAQHSVNCTKNMQWTWDGVTFSILHPGLSDYLLSHPKQDQKATKTRKYSGNNMSCVLLIESKSGNVLISGDIERSVENSLVNEWRRGLIDFSADVLVVPHHGSKTSSEPTFINAVNPKYALFAVGYRNRYGFPKPEIVERYLQRDIEFFDTSQYGAITFNLGVTENVDGPELYRNSVRRYWHTMPVRERATKPDYLMLK